MWTKWAVAGTLVCAGYGVKCVGEELAEEHVHTDRKYGHLGRRAKVFSWEYANCDIFDGACQKAAEKARREKAAAH
jgi:hypothetical protein